MTSAPILDVPFRQSTPLGLANAIQQYISNKYDQHPDMFTEDLAAIDQLRTDAINVQEPHQSGVRKLAEYAAQLQWIGGKFPIDIGADFTWYLALGYNTGKPVTQNNLQFERANILCNLAALYSQMATTSRRGASAAGLKTACNYYCAAAGVLKYLRESVIPELRSTPPEDMDAMALACLEQLMLAQAQECFWLKAVQDKNKDSVIARLAASVSDYFDAAAEFGIKASSIRSEWTSHMSAKHCHFAAAAQYRQACDCLERSKYGEEVARLKDSLDFVNEALTQGRHLNKQVLGDLLELKEKVASVLKGAEKDNDLIYLCMVPPAASLPRISRASMVSSKIPKEVSEGTSMLSDTGPYGAPLFAKLVPFAVHVAAGIYAERRDRLVNNTIIYELESLTEKLHKVLQSLSLPGALQALEKPLGLPPGIVAHAEEVRQQGGVEKLLASIGDIDKLRNNNVSIHREASDLLEMEASEDEQLRARYGTDRWNRQPSKVAMAKLARKMDQHKGYLESAGDSDKLVRAKLAEFESVMRLLGGRIHALEEYVPNSSRAILTPTVDREVGKLRQCMNEISRLESRRRRKLESLRQKAKADDITTAILVEANRLERENPLRKVEAADFEPLFSSRLETRYNTDKQLLAEESSEQEELIQRLREANSSFLTCRLVDSSLVERESAIQSLEIGYFKYKELMGNLESGRTFYNDLAKHLSQLRDECKHVVYQRRVEAGQLEVGITTSMHNMRISTPVGSPPPQQLPPQLVQQQQQQQQCSTPSPPQQPQPRPMRNAPATPQPIVPIPGLWKGDSSTPLRFGGSPAR